MPEKDIEVSLDERRKEAESPRPKYAEVAFRGFLEATPPDTYVNVIDLKLSSPNNQNSRYYETPDIVLFCENVMCNGQRIFRCSGGSLSALGASWRREFLTYTCRNCNSRLVHFAIAFYVNKSEGAPTFLKLGQVPAFGDRTPARLITLIGPDREIFLQGRRAENRGLGIGAFAYYRRVVENQKNRIIWEIARVAKLLGSKPETEELFAAAVAETQFAKSVEMVKDVIPQALLISGRNPLTLLHSALSKGLHNPEMTDEHCLRLAQSIRIILAELAERASEALKNDRDIQNAVSVLMAVPNVPRLTTTRSERTEMPGLGAQTVDEELTPKEESAPTSATIRDLDPAQS